MVVKINTVESERQRQGPECVQGSSDGMGREFAFLVLNTMSPAHNKIYQGKQAFSLNPNRSLEKVSCHFLMTAIRKTALYMLDL